MSGTTGTTAPGSPTTLFEHALWLHRRFPDEPLPRNGEPYPDETTYRRRPLTEPADRDRAERDAAAHVDAHFARRAAPPAELAEVVQGLGISHIPEEHIVAAAARAADREQARATGRWLVRHGTDRAVVMIGLALLTASGTDDDIPLIRTIGLLSRGFGPWAARALEGLPGGVGALFWLAERVTGWGRVHVVHALCGLDDPAIRPWLLRRAFDGDFLNAYFVCEFIEVARPHEVLDELDDDIGMVDHTGRLLYRMTVCSGMGMTLGHYPHAAAVLDAHSRRVGSLGPDLERYYMCALLAQHLTVASPEDVGCSTQQREEFRSRYLAVLDRDDWAGVARTGIAAEDYGMRWLANHRDPRLRLRAFPDRVPPEPEA
ncbi:hypothetical protein [Streptomyces sp. NPDC058623]|uniref:hypothetical protein n=1 Tax=Streptomyces sp. NPDC058623 TaxID=3346563 RepID=UPI003669E68E